MTSPPKIAVLLAHPLLDERVADAVHQRRAAHAVTTSLHRVAGAQVVDDRRAGVLQQEGLGQQRRDEVAGDELAAAVDEEAAVGVAVPGDADVGLLGDDALDDVRAVLFDERVGLVVRETCRRSRSTVASTWQGSRSNSFGATRPAMPLPASRTTLNGLIDGRVDERHHLLDVGVQDVLRLVRRPGVAAGGGSVSSAIMSRMSPMPASPLSGSASGAHHLDAVVLLRVVRRGDLRAAVELVADDREVQHVGGEHPVVDDVGALLARAVDEGGGQRRRRQAHVARHGDPAAPRDRRRSRGRSAARRASLISAGYSAADVVGLEDIRDSISMPHLQTLGQTRL